MDVNCAHKYGNRFVSFIEQLNGKGISVNDLLDHSKLLSERAQHLSTLYSLLRNGYRRNALGAPSSKIIVCLDEARLLLDNNDSSLLRAFRHALRELFDDYRHLFGVLLDTASRISNFSSSVLQDPSMKEKPSPDYIGKFFPPIFALNTFDVWVYKGYTGLDFTSSNQARQQLFSLGRHLWAAFFEAGENLNSVLSLEKAKISQAPCFTLLSYCVSFLITDQSMGEAYVAEHIRYTISINKDRTFAQTIQPSEPVLATPPCSFSRTGQDC